MAPTLMTSPDARTSDRYPAGSAAFPHRDLIGLGGLAPWELLFLIDEAEQWVALGRSAHKRDERLNGLTIINAFFENSTRTLLSFELAGKRLGADVVNMCFFRSAFCCFAFATYKASKILAVALMVIDVVIFASSMPSKSTSKSSRESIGTPTFPTSPSAIG